MTTEACSPEAPRRKAVKVAAASLAVEAGFTHVEDAVLETLTEMIQSFLFECGRSARSFAEISGRTEPMLTDVIMALVEMGFDVQTLPHYAKRPNKMVSLSPAQNMPAPVLRTLQAGEKKSHPSYITDVYPQFPDPHTYIKTASYKKPVTEYRIIRENAATQKCEVERALTRFIAKTGDTENLFPDDPYAFPLIACRSKEIPYLDALVPKNFDLDSEDSHAEKIHGQQKGPDSEKEDQSKNTDSNKPAAVTPVTPNTSMTSEAPPLTPVEPATPNKQGGENSDTPTDDSQIDNPYLRPIKMPKLKTGKSKSKY